MFWIIRHIWTKRVSWVTWYLPFSVHRRVQFPPGAQQKWTAIAGSPPKHPPVIEFLKGNTTSQKKWLEIEDKHHKKQIPVIFYDYKYSFNVFFLIASALKIPSSPGRGKMQCSVIIKTKQSKTTAGHCVVLLNIVNTQMMLVPEDNGYRHWWIDFVQTFVSLYTSLLCSHVPCRLRPRTKECAQNISNIYPVISNRQSILIQLRLQWPWLLLIKFQFWEDLLTSVLSPFGPFYFLDSVEASEYSSSV